MTRSAYRLIARADTDILFRRPSGPVSGAEFRAAAHAMAAALPDAAYLLNLCRDRYLFTVALAAAVLRGQVSLLTSDRSEERLLALASRFGAVASISDEAQPAATLPHHAMVIEPAAAPAGQNPLIPADRLAAIVFTSGSTGEPVGSRKSWGALAERSIAAGACFAMQAHAPSEIVGTVPPHHMYGLETTALLPLHAPAASWCGAAFYPGEVQRALEAVPAPRILVTTPLQIRAMLAAGIVLPGPVQVISATAPLPAELAAEAERLWQAPMREIFGATEVGSVASRRTVEGDRWQIYPGVAFSRTPEDSDGGSEVMVTAAHAEPCALNDEVELLEGGRFLLLGRKTDIIKLAGKRTSLAGLNRILNDIEGVSDGIFVAPDDLDQRASARLLAYVVAPDRSAEDILAALRRRIDPIFLPRRVIRVDDLPRNEIGKLPQAALAALRTRLGGA